MPLVTLQDAALAFGLHPLLDRATLARVVEMKVPVNAGSPQMLEQLGQVSPGHRVWLRINPGFGHGHSQKTNTGGKQSKHGIWRSQLAECLNQARRNRFCVSIQRQKQA